MADTEKKTSLLSLSHLSEGHTGPKMGLGGWGLPGLGDNNISPAAGPILGYCLEKITLQFAALRTLSTEGDALKKNLFVPTQPLGTALKSTGPSRKERQAIEAKKAVLSLVQSSETTPHDIQADLERFRDLPFDERVSLLQELPPLNTRPELLSHVLLHTLRTAEDDATFKRLLEAAGGQATLDQMAHDIQYGTLQCLLEKHGLLEWRPPFHHPLFQATYEGEAPLSLEGLKSQLTQDAPDLIQEEFINRFLIGDINAAELVGLTRDELYAIAKRGYDVLQEGKLALAQTIFEGLVYLDPYDAFFYTTLGSVRQRMGDEEGAILTYNLAITLQSWNVTALANRGELFYDRGQLAEAIADFQRVMTLDPNHENPSTLRVKTLLFALNEAIQQHSE